MTILGNRVETSHTSSIFGYEIDRSLYPSMEDLRINYEQDISFIVEAVGKRVPLWMRFVRFLSISQYGEDLEL